MFFLRKRWSWLLGIVLALSLLLGAWSLVRRSEWRVIGRYPCEQPPLATEGGLIYTTCLPEYLLTNPATLSLRGWDGRLRWTIAIPRSDLRAFRRWYPGHPPEIDGSRWGASPDGRTLAAVLYEPAGGRIMTWHDGKLQGDHHLPVRHGTLFDGKYQVMLRVLNDGRVYAYPAWDLSALTGGGTVREHPAPLATLFHHGRLAASGIPQVRIPSDRVYTLTDAGSRLRVHYASAGRGWLLPPGTASRMSRIPPRHSPDGRFALYCTKIHPAPWRSWPLLDRLPLPPRHSRWTLYEDPGVARASGWVEMDEGEGGVDLVVCRGRCFELQACHLSPDGRLLVAYDYGNALYYLQIR